MIRRLLQALGAHDERPEPAAARFPVTESEVRYERVRQQAEQTIARSDAATDLSRQRLVSWEDLYDPGRRR